ncbi:TetR/AcrR family transcriptional regulator [Paenibacillus xylanilyticus]|uniref:TetR/AcrR family transcriptional regulator n=1 Tax=Paenibacillus xylanilyticus TaxID=248903 RepID=A0A7Y6C019_9BACL|nr:TetR/AcrR family transcriptional regulator [Paenibacillus xylanilyticus]NUU77315.1 TetR/AcrR family transcriptional regulator [Paenibacillus xylanilyticus]
MNDHLSNSKESIHTVTTFQEARLQHSENLRQNIVHAAAALLQEHGPEAVTVRRVAERMECSTKIIYNLFGKKEGLAKYLYLEGCTLLSQSFEAVPQQASYQQHFRALAQAYWNFGMTQSSFYQLMFGGSFAEFKPDAESLEGTATALKQLTNLVEAAKGQGLLRKDNSLLAIQMIWAPLHGVIHLYLGGHIESEEAARRLYDHTLSMIVQSLFKTDM